MSPHHLTNKHLDQLVKLVRDTGGKASPYWPVLKRVDRELKEDMELERLVA